MRTLASNMHPLHLSGFGGPEESYSCKSRACWHSSRSENERKECEMEFRIQVTRMPKLRICLRVQAFIIRRHCNAVPSSGHNVGTASAQKQLPGVRAVIDQPHNPQTNQPTKHRCNEATANQPTDQANNQPTNQKPTWLSTSLLGTSWGTNSEQLLETFTFQYYSPEMAISFFALKKHLFHKSAYDCLN